MPSRVRSRSALKATNGVAVEARRLDLGDPESVAAMADLLEAPGAPVTAARFVLSQTSAWEDPELVSRAIKLLGAVIGEKAPQTLLAQASYLLQVPDRPIEIGIGTDGQQSRHEHECR